MDIKLQQLVKLSNNSNITHDILDAFNEKLNDVEKTKLNEWFKLVEIKSKENQIKFF